MQLLDILVLVLPVTLVLAAGYFKPPFVEQWATNFETWAYQKKHEHREKDKADNNAVPQKTHRCQRTCGLVLARLFVVGVLLSSGAVFAGTDPVSASGSGLIGFGSIFEQDLYYGVDKYGDVTLLQIFLHKQGLYNGLYTGDYLDQTRAAVARYQEIQGIKPSNGYFGLITRTSVLNTIYADPTFTFDVSDDFNRTEPFVGEKLFYVWVFVLFALIVSYLKIGFKKTALSFFSAPFILCGVAIFVALVGYLAHMNGKDEGFFVEALHLLSLLVTEIFVPSLHVLYTWISSISITKKDVFEQLGVVVWPVVVLIVALFFKKVFTYLFFSMEEFNFFGARGQLIDVKTMIAQEVEKEKERKNLSEHIKASSASLEDIEKAAMQGVNITQFREVVNIARQLAEDNKVLQKRLQGDAEELLHLSRMSRRDGTDTTLFLLSRQINDSISAGFQGMTGQLQTIATGISNTFEKIQTLVQQSTGKEKDTVVGKDESIKPQVKDSKSIVPSRGNGSATEDEVKSP